MSFCPAFWPNYISVNEGCSELWLLVMGVTQMVLGAWTMGFNEVPRLLHALAAWEPVKLDFELADVRWVLPESFYAGLNDDEDLRVALILQQQLRFGSV